MIGKHSLYGEHYTLVSRAPSVIFLQKCHLPPGGRLNSAPIYKRPVCISETFNDCGFFLSKFPKIFPFHIDNTRKKRYNIKWIFRQLL